MGVGDKDNAKRMIQYENETLITRLTVVKIINIKHKVLNNNNGT